MNCDICREYGVITVAVKRNVNICFKCIEEKNNEIRTN